ncbi:MAG: septal ring lytic transglycosylase RlpA family protein [Rhodobiaceae bacterium]|nr:septal ring lytic transglycosylase RlpA family protein [Rhodobiaceae bacterium]
MKKHLLLPALAVLPFLFVSSGAKAAQCGIASWYSHAGKRTANGEIANPAGFTAAHRSLPFGTKVTVTNIRNGRSVVVRVNDRGPFVKGRVIDLSKAAAAQIGLVATGTGKVRVDGASGSGC